MRHCDASIFFTSDDQNQFLCENTLDHASPKKTLFFRSVNMTVNQGASSEAMESIGRPPIWCRSRSPKPGFSTSQPLQADMDRGRTIGNGLLQACLLLLKI